MRKATHFVLLFTSLLLLITALVQAQISPTPSFPSADQTICAGNVPPDGTVIVATGSSPQCGGSCRGRQVDKIHGAVMVICAQQPIPIGYELQSVTSAPACNCIGEDDNAYVIRRTGPEPSTSPTPQPETNGERSSPSNR